MANLQVVPYKLRPSAACLVGLRNPNLNLYRMLGITKRATDDDIKRAYYDLSRIYHPDKEGGDHDKFTEVTAAYKILSDKYERAMYDSNGMSGIQMKRTLENLPYVGWAFRALIKPYKNNIRASTLNKKQYLEMPGSRASGLLRYDANTLQPIRGRIFDEYEAQNRYSAPQDISTTFPRISANRMSGFSGRQTFDVNGPMSSVPLTPPYGVPPLYSRPSLVVDDLHLKDQLTERDSWAVKLHKNYHIGVHRFAFLAKKLPALAIAAIAAWILWGRGNPESTALVSNRNDTSSFERTQQEYNAALIAWISSGVILVGAVFAVHNHNHSHKAAHQQKELKYPPQCYPNECFSKTERIINVSCILGLSILVAVLASVSVIFGLQAVFRLEKDRKHIRRNTAVTSYTNPIALATTDRY
ncbi:dnaJ domain-containing protein [Ditylenchus destructor]|nr:dnaJ domain-containing protein [Ditylenchus destructor]